MDEHGRRPRYVRTARTQSQEQQGDDHDVVGAVLLEEPVSGDAFRMVVVITKWVDDGPADPGRIRRKKRVAKPVDGPREEISEEIADQETRSQPGPSRGGPQRIGQAHAEQHEHAHGCNERARFQHGEGYGLIDGKRLIGHRSKIASYSVLSASIGSIRVAL